MKRNNTGMSGMTLLEVMLVLGIGTSLVLLGIRAYQGLRRDADTTQVQFNVDMIFQAAANYYHAHCRPVTDPITGPVTTTDPELLAPSTFNTPNIPAPKTPVTIDTLVAEGYLSAHPSPNALVAADGPPNYGYILQFNEELPYPPKYMTTKTTPPTNIQVGQIVMWRIQVAVKLRNVVTKQAVSKLLLADCLSSSEGTTPDSVTPCKESPAAGAYAVWERLPSFAVPGSNSGLWMTNANVEQFTQLYGTESATYAASSTNPSNTTPTATPYFYCGG